MKKTNLTRLCVVVDDVKKTAENYCRYFRVDAERIQFAEDRAVIPMNNAAIELVAPPSSEVFRKLLSQSGNGVYYVETDGDAGSFADVIREQGAESIVFDREEHSCFHTSRLFGMNLACTGNQKVYPEAGEKTVGVTHLGLVTHDWEQVCENCYRYLGAKPEETTDLVLTSRGEKLPAVGAHVFLGNMWLELFQPTGENGIFSDYMLQCGEGVYFVGVDYEIEAYCALMQEMGIEAEILNEDGFYACFDTRGLFGFRTMVFKH